MNANSLYVDGRIVDADVCASKLSLYNEFVQTEWDTNRIEGNLLSVRSSHRD